MAEKIALCLYGKFANRYDPEAGKAGFDYIKKRILSGRDVDVYIYSFDLNNEQRIRDLYEPWAKSVSFTLPPNFELLMEKNFIREEDFEPPSRDRPLVGTLAFFYQRDMVVKELFGIVGKSSEVYNKVIISRFDLGQVDKHNGSQSFRVSEIGPVSSMDTLLGAYTSAWNQFNEGMPDQWMVLSQTDAAAFSGSFDRLMANLSPDSGYQNWIANGILDSNSSDPFSNEAFKIGTRLSSSTRRAKRGLDNHLLLKYDFIQTGIYSRLRPSFDSHGLASLTYSHTSYADALKVGVGQRARHLGSFEQEYLALEQTETDMPSFPISMKRVSYDESESYSARLLQVLRQIPDDVLLFTHEDMPLIRTPSTTALLQGLSLLNASERNASVRLIRVGRPTLLGRLAGILGATFTRTPSWSRWQFSIQPTLWKRRHLIELLVKAGDQSIWDLEVFGQKFFRKLKLRAFQPVTAGNQRGKYHGDSLVYPYVATAIVKGFWNTSEYPELIELAASYGIDVKVRGER
jgi:hypothetical protein